MNNPSPYPAEWGVHITHCCRRHGCKYGDDDCPVIHDLAVQAYKCEYETFDGPCLGMTDEEYWRERCKAAEAFISESPCDPDVTPEQIKAHAKWEKLKSIQDNYHNTVWN